jgi:Na+/H+ antiporter NhaA
MPIPTPFRRVTEFLRTESAGGAVLVVATVVALVWANAAAGSYHNVWSFELAIPGPEHALTLGEWVNEGLMAVFFFVVGLEIKREIVEGELHDPRTAAVPIAASIGGMAIPVALFAIVTAGTAFGHGWGIAMATDIAFALAVLRLAGPRVPRGVGLTLLTLAIVDDLGAIAVIAVFYSSGLSLGWLLTALGTVGVVIGIRRRVEHPAWYVIPAIVLWVALLRSGIHATIAGVLLGFLTPVRTRSGREVLATLEHRLNPWSSFLVLPLFALANAGIVIDADRLRAAASSRLAIGVVLGLVVGKLVGITGGTWIATRLGGRLPEGVGVRGTIAVGLLGGIGFTVSLFVAGLAFTGESLNTAKLAILAASVGAAIASMFVLRTITPEMDTST